MDNHELANRISELRRERGMSQKELGDMLGVSNKAVSKWENGEAYPKTATLLKIAELFEIDANELLGMDGAGSTEPADNGELDRLKSENFTLQSKLNKIKARRKRTFAIVIAVCIVFIIGSAVLTVCFTGGIKKYNKDITDAGAADTKIVFNDITFVPCNRYEEYAYVAENPYVDSLGDRKYADYYDSQGDRHNALISCDRYSNAVKLSADGEDYYYIKEELSGFEISFDNITSMVIFDKTVSNKQNYYPNYSKTVYKGSNYYDSSFIRLFAAELNSFDEPVDKKITEFYLGNEGCKVSLFFDDDTISKYKIYSIDAGEFFKDDDGNVYFYSYMDTCSYSVGEELSDLVYNVY